MIYFIIIVCECGITCATNFVEIKEEWVLTFTLFVAGTLVVSVSLNTAGELGLRVPASFLCPTSHYRFAGILGHQACKASAVCPLNLLASPSFPPFIFYPCHVILLI